MLPRSTHWENKLQTERRSTRVIVTESVTQAAEVKTRSTPETRTREAVTRSILQVLVVIRSTRVVLVVIRSTQVQAKVVDQVRAKASILHLNTVQVQARRKRDPRVKNNHHLQRRLRLQSRKMQQ